MAGRAALEGSFLTVNGMRTRREWRRLELRQARQIETLPELVGLNRPRSPDDRMLSAETELEVHELLAWAPLSQRERWMVFDRYGFNGEPMSLNALGDKYRDIGRKAPLSSTRVRQILEKALCKLRNAVRSPAPGVPWKALALERGRHVPTMLELLDRKPEWKPRLRDPWPGLSPNAAKVEFPLRLLERAHEVRLLEPEPTTDEAWVVSDFPELPVTWTACRRLALFVVNPSPVAQEGWTVLLAQLHLDGLPAGMVEVQCNGVLSVGLGGLRLQPSKVGITPGNVAAIGAAARRLGLQTWCLSIELIELRGRAGVNLYVTGRASAA